MAGRQLILCIQQKLGRVSISFLEDTAGAPHRLGRASKLLSDDNFFFSWSPHFRVSHFTTFQKTKPHTPTTIWCLQINKRETLACVVLAAAKTNGLLSLLLFKSKAKMLLRKHKAVDKLTLEMQGRGRSCGAASVEENPLRVPPRECCGLPNICHHEPLLPWPASATWAQKETPLGARQGSLEDTSSAGEAGVACCLSHMSSS